MLIFYVSKTNEVATITKPIVIIDALCSDDRFDTAEIKTAVKENAPDGVSLSSTDIFSCEYTAQFEHIGMPIGAAIKTKFSGTLKSPPADLVSAFSPKFLTSSQNVKQLANALSTIPNAQTHIVYSAMVFKTASGKIISRQFILYSAPLFPDGFGTTTTMVLSGAMIDDILIKSTTFCQIDKKTTLKSQITKFLASQDPALIGNYDNAPQADDKPATEILLKPMKLADLLSEICLQNKMIFKIDHAKHTVYFYGQGQDNAPKTSLPNPPEFSFLGLKGFIAWALGVENYANIRFKTSLFDPQIFTKIYIYNDIESAFFGGLTKDSTKTIKATALNDAIDAYGAWIIRYVIRWSRIETLCEITASNNWLMGQFRIDALLESVIYSSEAVTL